MIVDYDEKYIEQVKDLLLELAEYIASIDREGYNTVTNKTREEIFLEDMKKLKENDGIIRLYLEDDKIIGLIMGTIIKEEDTHSFKVPRRGRINELIVSRNSRSAGIGSKLISNMEEYLKEKECNDILIEVFGYNDLAYDFYIKHGYHNRLFEVTKSIN